MPWTPLPLDEALTFAARLAHEEIARELAPHLGGPGARVAEAALYACEGGKGLRAMLVIEGARLKGISPDKAAPAAGAIEAMHAYSLIHDDLPCMDDDDLRRGRPTVHRRWDEATAVLAGDALQALAFGLAARTGRPGWADRGRLTLVRTLAEAAGAGGMVGGQAADIEAEGAGAPLSLEGIEALQARKTGALITWAACAGARMDGGGGEGDWLAPIMRRYGDALGLAFQIADDILDATGDVDTVGKAVGKDAGRNKATFVSLLGIDGARARATSLIEEACAALDPFGSQAETLREAARFVLARRR